MAKASMNNQMPVVVRMQFECAQCGHTEDEAYEFYMAFAKSKPIEANEPGECPQCGAPVQMHLKRTQQRRKHTRFALARI